MEHVIVASAHYGDDDASQALMRRLLEQHSAATRQWLPRLERSLVLVVENDAFERSRGAVEALNLSYALNRDYPDFGFELGAWRWALKVVLPSLEICADAVVYLTQDSLILNREPISYPPPATLNATRIYSFDGTKALNGVPRSERHFSPEAVVAFRNVSGSDQRRHPSRFIASSNV